ncbi:hypothetical protein EYF80_034319 [Liparis tanakae]|uniref:Uncharacterized protein n=1 Tax=Liparis tanakae TaxID=230148 RepID=A0A4Z2GPG2_9TELE|nr:hypothetical protein EYF80_034319 [Liparis tanakae]
MKSTRQSLPANQLCAVDRSSQNKKHSNRDALQNGVARPRCQHKARLLTQAAEKTPTAPRSPSNPPGGLTLSEELLRLHLPLCVCLSPLCIFVQISDINRGFSPRCYRVSFTLLHLLRLLHPPPPPAFIVVVSRPAGLIPAGSRAVELRQIDDKRLSGQLTLDVEPGVTSEIYLCWLMTPRRKSSKRGAACSLAGSSAASSSAAAAAGSSATEAGSGRRRRQL